CGLHGVRHGFRGRWSLTWMACTTSAFRRRDSSLFFRGRGSRLQDWRWDSSCKVSGQRQWRAFISIGLAGAVLIEFARWLDRQPRQFYAVDDYWHTSPSFFLIRVGMLLVILAGSYSWCRWGAGQRGFSPLIQLGQASLLVYWVHIEFVYGRVSILPKHAMGIGGASVGLLLISLAMLGLA